MIVKALVEGAFERLARLRSARVFHPTGVTFAGTLEVAGSATRLAEALGGGSWPVVVRASKGIGTPQRWPDFYGLAVRLAHQRGPVDLLFATVPRAVPYLLAPARTWDAQPYSTVLPYAVGAHRILLRLEPERQASGIGGDVPSIEEAVSEAPLSLALWESAGLDWHPAGRLTLTSVSHQQIAFDPVVNEHPQLRHWQPLRALRAWAYTGSRRGRGAKSAELFGDPRPESMAASGADAGHSSAISNSSSQELQR